MTLSYALGLFGFDSTANDAKREGRRAGETAEQLDVLFSRLHGTVRTRVRCARTSRCTDDS